MSTSNENVTLIRAASNVDSGAEPGVPRRRSRPQRGDRYSLVEPDESLGQPG
jgi:hypothetical protein